MLSETYPCSECELQIVGAEVVVINCSIKCLLEQILVPEQVFGYTQPETEKLQYVNTTTDSSRSPCLWLVTYRCGAYHMVIRNNAKFRPTVDNGKQTKVAVRWRLLAWPVGQ